jgi:hypothetical protein
LGLLDKLNNEGTKFIISYTDLQKEQENIKDLHLLDEETTHFLNCLEEINNLSTDEVVEYICQLNVSLNTYVWHTESVRDIIEKFLYYERFKL